MTLVVDDDNTKADFFGVGDGADVGLSVSAKRLSKLFLWQLFSIHDPRNSCI